MTPELMKLLERYHDGEVSTDETTRVESLLESDVEALEYLGGLDAMAELVSESVHQQVSAVAFEGFWEGVHGRILEEEEAAVARVAADAEPSFVDKVTGWLSSIFVEHKSAWITATATAAAVLLVINVWGPGQNTITDPGVASNGGEVTKVIIEKHIVYVDSVDKADPDSTVLVNSIKAEEKDEEDVNVIWLLPNQQPAEQGEEDSDEGIEIIEESL